MQWGNTQNLLSVIIGVNLAYSAFKELRAPYLDTLQRQFSLLEAEVARRTIQMNFEHDLPSHASFLLLWRQIMSTESELKAYGWQISSYNVERFAGIPSLLVSLVGTCLLIYSSLWYEKALTAGWFWSIVIVGVAPIALHIARHFWIIHFLRSRYEPKLKEYRDRLADLLKTYMERLPPDRQGKPDTRTQAN
jgi:hypothetical protein